MFSVHDSDTRRLRRRVRAASVGPGAIVLAVTMACGGDASRQAGGSGRNDGAGAVGRAAGALPVVSTQIVVDGDDGVRVTLDRPAMRVVSLIPGRTDAILALGAGDRLVARTRYDEDPRIAQLPSLQDALTPSIEWLLEQRPDLVIAWPDRQSRSVVTRLRELGVPVYASNVETVADTRRAIAALGLLLGSALEADSILASIDTTIARVRRAVTDLPRVRVLYLIGIDPPMAAAGGTFIDEMIRMAGGENVLADASTRWPPVSLEEIVARQPDLLLIAVESPAAAVVERLRAMPGMTSVSAVRDGHIRVLDASLFNRPGPSIIEALRALSAAIHPEVVIS